MMLFQSLLMAVVFVALVVIVWRWDAKCARREVAKRETTPAPQDQSYIWNDDSAAPDTRSWEQIHANIDAYYDNLINVRLKEMEIEGAKQSIPGMPNNNQALYDEFLKKVNNR